VCPGFVGDSGVPWVSRGRSGGIAVVTLPSGIHDESISESFSPKGARIARNGTARKARRRRS